jgi:histidinol-phosphate aminotransferase
MICTGRTTVNSGIDKIKYERKPVSSSPQVLKSVKDATDARLRLYPNPTAQKLREKLAQFHNCATDNIIVGNGSDELLALATRAL